MRPDQSVRDLRAGEIIPNLSTASLLSQHVPPLSEWPITSRPWCFKQPEKVQKMGKIKAAEAASKASYERYAPHIGTIKAMRKAGSSYKEIGYRIDKSAECVRKFIKRHVEASQEIAE